MICYDSKGRVSNNGRGFIYLSGTCSVCLSALSPYASGSMYGACQSFGSRNSQFSANIHRVSYLKNLLVKNGFSHFTIYMYLLIERWFDEKRMVKNTVFDVYHRFLLLIENGLRRYCNKK